MLVNELPKLCLAIHDTEVYWSPVHSAVYIIQDVQIRNSCRCFCLHHPYVIVKLTLLYEHLRGVHVPPLSKEYVLKALDERRAAEVKVGKPGGGFSP